MSNFLDKFSKNNYGDLVKEKIDEVPIKNNQEKPINSDEQANNERIVFEEVKANRIQEEHDVVIDTDYQKKKKKKYIIISAVAIGVVLSLVLLFNYFNRVEVKNFVGNPVSEVKTWGLKQGVEIEIEYVFDIKYEANLVVEQNVKSGKSIRKSSILKVKVSKGPNMDEKIELPDFATMNLSQVEEWISENKATKVEIEKIFDETIALNSVIKTEFKDVSVTKETYKRKDKLIIYVSKGPEVFEKTIVVKDFINQDKSIAEAWARENSVEVIYEKAGSDTVAEGSIISQSVVANEKIAKNEKITVVVSIGKLVKVPDFSKFTKEDAATALDGVSITVKSQYNEKVLYGKLLSQSIPKGTTIASAEGKITVIYSEGRPYIDNLEGMKEKELITYFYDFQSKGANITYSVEYVSGPKGIVVSSNYFSEYLPMSVNVVVKVGNGQ